MHFYGGFLNSCDGVPYCYARVSIRSGVYNQQIIIAFLNKTQNLPLAVKLYRPDIKTKLCSKGQDIVIYIFKGLSAIYGRLSLAEEV